MPWISAGENSRPTRQRVLPVAVASTLIALLSGCAGGSRLFTVVDPAEAIRAQSASPSLPAGLASSRPGPRSGTAMPDDAAAPRGGIRLSGINPGVAGGWAGLQARRPVAVEERRRPIVLSARVETTVERDAIRAWSDLIEQQNNASSTGGEDERATDAPPTPAQAGRQPSDGRIRLRRPTTGAAVAPSAASEFAAAETAPETSGFIPHEHNRPGAFGDGDAATNAGPDARTEPRSGAANAAGPGVTEVRPQRPEWPQAAAPPAATRRSPSAPASEMASPRESPSTIGSAAARGPTADDAAGGPELMRRGDSPSSQVPTIPQSPSRGIPYGPGDALRGDSRLGPPPVADDSPTRTAEAREPTMLDRIRDLYPARRDESPAETIRRPFRRLQSPWSLFAERDVQADPLAAAPAEADSVGPPVVALAPETSDPRALLELVIEQLQQQIEEWPRDAAGQPVREAEWRRTHADMRLLQLIADQPGEAAAVIPGLPPSEQEYWQALMLALVYSRDHNAAAPQPQRMQEAVDQLRVAVRRLQTAAELRIRRLTFCNSIHGFGSFDAFPSATFRPGQPVLLYAELDNFQSSQTASGTYRTEFSAVLQILRREDSEVLETIRLPAIPDETVSERTDYYQSYELTIPAHLRPGSYVVRLNVQDQLDGRRAEATAAFDVR